MPRTTRSNRQPNDGLGAAYRQAEPYMAACYSLVGSVAGFTLLGYWLDRRWGHSVQWLLVVGAVFGMVVGFVSFFAQIARAGRSEVTARTADRSPGAVARRRRTFQATEREQRHASFR